MVRRRAPQGQQLTLPLAEAARTATALPVDDLLALHDAMRLLVRVADGAVDPSSEAIEDVHGALAFLGVKCVPSR
jgi:hypothetical protein